MDLSTANVFRLGYSGVGVRDGLFDNTAGGWGGALAEDTFVLCDVFLVTQAKLSLPNGETVTPGTPILYYRADPSKKSLRADEFLPEDLIYNFRDNFPLISLRRLVSTEEKSHDLKWCSC